MIEAKFIAMLYQHIRNNGPGDLDIGVITPYRKQVECIKNELTNWDNPYETDVEVDTVDSFQAREKDVIIFSCVRTSKNIGFLSNVRRLNVAISRSKYGLYVVGNASKL